MVELIADEVVVLVALLLAGAEVEVQVVELIADEVVVLVALLLGAAEGVVQVVEQVADEIVLPVALLLVGAEGVLVEEQGAESDVQPKDISYGLVGTGQLAKFGLRYQNVGIAAKASLQPPLVAEEPWRKRSVLHPALSHVRSMI